MGYDDRRNDGDRSRRHDYEDEQSPRRSMRNDDGGPPRSRHPSRPNNDRPSRDPYPEERPNSRNSRPRDPYPEERPNSRNSRPRDPYPEERSQSRNSRPRDPYPEERPNNRNSRPRDPYPEERPQSRNSRPRDPYADERPEDRSSRSRDPYPEERPNSRNSRPRDPYAEERPDSRKSRPRDPYPEERREDRGSRSRDPYADGRHDDRESKPRDLYPEERDVENNPPSRSRRPADVEDPDESLAPRRSSRARERGAAIASDINHRARGAVRRAREGFTQMYEAASREMRSLSERARSRLQHSVDDRSREEYALSRRDSYREEYEEDADDASHASRVPAKKAAAELILHDRTRKDIMVPGRHSLTMRLRKRRAKLRGTNPVAAYSTAGVTIILAIVIGISGYLGYHLNDINTTYAKNIALLTQQKDNQTTRIYDRNGVLLSEISDSDTGGRTYLTYCQLPDNIMKATVDTEDSSFWTNVGVNFVSLAEALTRNTASGSAVSGASTITQQVVKNVILANSTKSGLAGVQRKLDEAMISLEITQQYTKPDILTLYLNTIPYGGVILGIESAAQNYFHLKPKTLHLKDTEEQKSWTDADWAYYHRVTDSGSGCQVSANQETAVESAAWQLTDWQALLLAGVPQSPTCHNPYRRPHDALIRFRNGVIPNVAKHDPDLITDSTAYADKNKVHINNYVDNPDGLVNYVYNQIRDPDHNEQDAQGFGCGDFDDVLTGLPKLPDNYQRAIFASSGENGNQLKRAPYFVDYIKDFVLPAKIGDISPYLGNGWNIYTTLDYGNPDLSEEQLDSIYIDSNGDLASGELNAEQLKTVGMQQYAEMVVRRNILGGVHGTYPDWWYCGLSTGGTVITWNGPYPRDKNNPFENQPTCERQKLNTPLAQGGKNVGNGSVVVLDPRNGDILAMVGGADYYEMNDKRAGQYNMTIQPRSLGSSFKPIVYATALEMGWNPGTVIPDEPTCFPSGAAANATPTDKSICTTGYVGHNYSPYEWNGYEPLTELLGNSLNTPAALTLQFTGLSQNQSPILSMAQRLGITTLSADRLGPTTALGTQEVSLLEETEAYATFANNGVHMPSRAILRLTDFLGNIVKDNQGHPLFDDSSPPQGGQAISPQAAYQLTSILTNNSSRYGDFGPTNPLHFWNRDVAAKTGTSQDIKDIVTMGYTPGLAIGAWAGNNDDTPMDPNILGVAGAAYIFNAIMAFGIDRLNLPGTKPAKSAQAVDGGYFPVPNHMHRAQLSCTTGMAPYQGQDVTKQCYLDAYAYNFVQSPNWSDTHNPNYWKPVPSDIQPYIHQVPLELTPEFSPDNGHNPNPTNPNVHWTCLAWGCDKSDAKNIGGSNIAWMIDGQDPLSP
jgi:membrane peptidoglycan carboxypeptidase